MLNRVLIKYKLIVVIVLAILIVIFVLQNAEIVSIRLWFWEANTSRALLIILCIAVGIIIGIIVPSSRKKVNSKKND